MLINILWSDLTTMATLGAEEGGYCREGAIMGRYMKGCNKTPAIFGGGEGPEQHFCNIHVTKIHVKKQKQEPMVHSFMTFFRKKNLDFVFIICHLLINWPFGRD